MSSSLSTRIVAMSLLADYGYVIQARKAKKLYGVEYPDMYSAESKVFDCIQCKLICDSVPEYRCHM